MESAVASQVFPIDFPSAVFILASEKKGMESSSNMKQ